MHVPKSSRIAAPASTIYSHRFCVCCVDKVLEVLDRQVKTSIFLPKPLKKESMTSCRSKNGKKTQVEHHI
jgi:hypothetical protein